MYQSALPIGSTDGVAIYDLYARTIDPETGVHTSELLSGQTIAPGVGTLYTIGTDGEGNPTAVEGVTDGTAPSLTVDSPADGTTVSSATVTFTGTASDEEGGSGLNSVRVGDTSCVIDSGSWTCVDVPLEMGENALTAVATDNAGNQTSAQITVTRNVAPVLTITDPVDNAISSSSVLESASGTVTGVAGSTVEANGKPCWVTGEEWVCEDIPLNDSNVITVTATGPQGGTATATVALETYPFDASTDVSCEEGDQDGISCELNAAYDNENLGVSSSFAVSTNGGRFMELSSTQCDFYSTDCFEQHFNDGDRCAVNPGAVLTYRSRLGYSVPGNPLHVLLAVSTTQINCGWQPTYLKCQEGNHGDVGCNLYASGYEGTPQQGEYRLAVSADGGPFVDVATVACDANGHCGDGSTHQTDAGRCAASPDVDLTYRARLVDAADPEAVLAEASVSVPCGRAETYQPTANIDCELQGENAHCAYSAHGYVGTAGHGSNVLEVSVDGGAYTQLGTHVCDDQTGLCNGGDAYEAVCSAQPFGTSVQIRSRLIDDTSAEADLATSAQQLTCGQPILYAHPEKSTQQDTANFGFAPAESGVLECSLDGSTFSECEDYLSYPGLLPGPHSFKVRQTNEETEAVAETGWDWDIDVTPPTIQISSPVEGADAEASTVDVRGTVGDAGLAVSVNGTPCVVHGHNWHCDKLPVWGFGGHYEASVIDAAGNAASATIHLAHGPLVIDSAPSAYDNQTETAIAFHSTMSGTAFTCESDGVTISPCTSPLDLSDLGDGSHSVHIYASRSGSAYSETAVVNWDIVRTTPTVAITSPSPSTLTYLPEVDSVSGYAYGDGVGVRSVAVNGKSCEVTLQYGQYQFSCLGVPLDEGSGDLTAIVTDLAGNTSSAVVSLARVSTSAVASISCTNDVTGSVHCDFGATGYDATPYSSQSRVELAVGDAPFTGSYDAQVGWGWCNSASGNCTGSFNRIELCAQHPGETLRLRHRVYDGYTPIAQSVEEVHCGAQPAFVACRETGFGNVGCGWYAGGYAGTAGHGVARLEVKVNDGSYQQVASTSCGADGVCGSFASESSDSGRCSANPTSVLTYRVTMLDDTAPGEVLSQMVSQIQCAPETHYGTTATLSCRPNGSVVSCDYRAQGYQGADGHGVSVLERSVDGQEYSQVAYQSCGGLFGSCSTSEYDYSQTCGSLPFGTVISYRTRLFDDTDSETTLAEANAQVTCGKPAVTNDWSGDGHMYSMGNNVWLGLGATMDGTVQECRIDGGEYSECNWSVNYSDLEEGPHSFEVRSTETATQATLTYSATIFIDTAAPTISITSPVGEVITDDDFVRVTGTVSDNVGGSGVQYVTEGAFGYCTFDAPNFICNVPMPFGDSLTSPEISIQDYAGNYAYVSLPIRRPGIILDTAPPRYTTATSVSGQFHSAKPNTTFTCALDYEASVPCTDSFSYADLSEGEHTVTVTGTSPGFASYHTYTGTEYTATKIIRVTVDWTAPNLYVSTPVDGADAYSTGIPSVQGSVEDYGSGMDSVVVNGKGCTIFDDTGIGNLSWECTDVPFIEGSPDIVIAATDRAGHVVTTTLTMNVIPAPASASVTCDVDETNSVTCEYGAAAYAGAVGQGTSELLVSTDDGENYSLLDSQTCDDETGDCGPKQFVDAETCPANPGTALKYRSRLYDATDAVTILAESEPFTVQCGE